MTRATQSFDEQAASSAAVEPGPEHRRLDVFLGKWTTEGQQYESPFGPAAPISAVQTYEWLTGGLFLVHRLEGRLGHSEMACIEITGWESASGGYPTRTFYNDGKSSHWLLRESAGIWTITGDWEPADDALEVRCTLTFADGGNTQVGKWEYADEGVWKTFWDVKSTRT